MLSLVCCLLSVVLSCYVIRLGKQGRTEKEKKGSQPKGGKEGKEEIRRATRTGRTDGRKTRDEREGEVKEL
jgi:hypothetical protein